MPLGVICGFNRVKQLLKKHPHTVVADILAEKSTLLIVDDARAKLRRAQPLPDFDLEDVQSRTVVAENFGADTPTIDGVRQRFLPAGEVLMVRVRHPGMQTPAGATAKSGLDLVHVASGAVHALVEFATREDAARSVEMFNDDKDWRNGLRVRLLVKNLGKKKKQREQREAAAAAAAAAGEGAVEGAEGSAVEGAGGRGGRRRGRGRRGRVARKAEEREGKVRPPKERLLAVGLRGGVQGEQDVHGGPGRDRRRRRGGGGRRGRRRVDDDDRGEVDGIPRRAEAADDAGRHARVRRQRFGSGETRASSRYPSRSAGARRRGEGDGGVTYHETSASIPRRSDVPLGVISIPHRARSTRLATTSDVARLSTIRTERTRAVVSFASSLTRFLHP